MHAAEVFNYECSVIESVESNKDMFVSTYMKLLTGMKEKGQLERVERKYSSSEHPFMFITFAAHVLDGGNEDNFFVINVAVSLNLRTYNLHILG